jgi:hypothetical protein
MEVKGSEAQGRYREVRSEGSVEQRYEPTNRNWIRGVKVGRVSMRSRSPYPSSTGNVNPAVVYQKCVNLLREICGMSKRTESRAICSDPDAEVSSGYSKQAIAEGPNNREW